MMILIFASQFWTCSFTAGFDGTCTLKDAVLTFLMACLKELERVKSTVWTPNTELFKHSMSILKHIIGN